MTAYLHLTYLLTYLLYLRTLWRYTNAVIIIIIIITKLSIWCRFCHAIELASNLWLSYPIVYHIILTSILWWYSTCFRELCRYKALLLLLLLAIMMTRDVCDVQGVLVSVSVLTLTVISVERYYAICHPFHFKATSRRARSMIVVVWIISLVIMLPEFIVLKTFRHFPDHLPTDILTTCKPAWEYRHQVQAAVHSSHLYNIACMPGMVR